MMQSKYIKVVLTINFVSALLLSGCDKDKVPQQTIVEPTKWEKISGNYKVYDTLGIFLYDLSISHHNGIGNNTDSLYFENLDNKFSYSYWQSPWGWVNDTYIIIGDVDPITDKFGNRWHLFQETDENFNVLKNDTIYLKFWKSNIQYYLEDLTPYYEGFSVQIAVKQH